MITRIVQMQFAEKHIQDFEKLFHDSCEHIRQMPGCISLQLLQDKKDPSIFFTVSRWSSESDLEYYRSSPLFAGIWPQTKILFAEKARAWTVHERMQL